MQARRRIVAIAIATARRRWLYTSPARCVDPIYQQVPHYKLNSALYFRPGSSSSSVDSTTSLSVHFPRLVTPELDVHRLLECAASLTRNLNARHISLNLGQLQYDHARMCRLREQLDEIESRKQAVSDQVNRLVKTGLADKKTRAEIMKRAEMVALLKQGAALKPRIGELIGELGPLEERVTISCLRLPNDLHACALLGTQCSEDDSDEAAATTGGGERSRVWERDDRDNIVLFSMNAAKKSASANTDSTKGVADWRTLLVSRTSSEQALLDEYVNESTTTDTTNLSAKYMIGALARVEQALVDFFYDKMNGLNNEAAAAATSENSSSLELFEHIKSVSMFRTAIIEGCGENFKDSNKILNIVKFSKTAPTASQSSSSSSSNAAAAGGIHVDLHHLTGSSSLNALVLNFVRTKIERRHLPWHVFTNGKCYSPRHGQLNTFDMLTLSGGGGGDDGQQSSLMIDEASSADEQQFAELIERCERYADRVSSELARFRSSSAQKQQSELVQQQPWSNDIDALLVDTLKLLVYVYGEFNTVPVRFTCVSANELEANESLRVDVQAYMPSERDYITVGKVSLLNDYVSRRLQIRVKENDKEPKQQQQHEKSQHCLMIHTRLVDITTFMQALVENSCCASSSSRFQLPTALEKFYLTK